MTTTPHPATRTAALAAFALLPVLALTACSSSGEERSIGQSASVEVAKGHHVDVTVLALEAGTAADLAQLKDSSQYAGRTPYYLRYSYIKTQDEKVRWTGDFEVHGDDGPLTQLDVLPSLDSTGNPDDPFDVRTFEKCESGTDFDKVPKGGTVEGCDIFLTDTGGGTPKDVKWVDDSDKTLVTWK
ncbi:hypothetical protein [Streptomyces sp. NPDC127092]|uniref:hypothetical protein n=1 Tax=Streptomyces sp. NPDC127092 TaxID=3347135 RepID=UPI0036526DDE